LKALANRIGREGGLQKSGRQSDGCSGSAQRFSKVASSNADIGHIDVPLYEWWILQPTTGKPCAVSTWLT
jgi:hypothetical protein